MQESNSSENNRNRAILPDPAPQEYKLSDFIAKITSENLHQATDWDRLKVRNPGEIRFVPDTGDFIWLTFDPRGPANKPVGIRRSC